MSSDPTRRSQAARFELHDETAQRGPEGTVPVLRKKLSAISGDQPLSQYLSRRPAWAGRRSVLAPLAGGVGSHHYALAGQRAVAYGAGGTLSVIAPYTETSADFSLLQVGIINDQEGAMQSVEAGIQVMQTLYGDWGPHLFVYFTTNGYAGGGDYVGGYNFDVSGWIQVDGSVYPGAGFAATSTPGGDQHDLGIRFELFAGNWWLLVAGTWIGYYPASLYEGTRSAYSSLADHATWVSMMGEVFDSEAVPGPTTTDMGSGHWADAQWPWAAYQRNLTIQGEPGGGLQDFNADGLLVSSPAMYGLETHMLSGSEWGSYQYLGGPGAG